MIDVVEKESMPIAIPKMRKNLSLPLIKNIYGKALLQGMSSGASRLLGEQASRRKRSAENAWLKSILVTEADGSTAIDRGLNLKLHDCAAPQFRLPLAPNYQIASDDHIFNAFGILPWILEGRPVNHLMRIENDQIRERAFFDSPMIAEP